MVNYVAFTTLKRGYCGSGAKVQKGDNLESNNRMCTHNLDLDQKGDNLEPATEVRIQSHATTYAHTHLKKKSKKIMHTHAYVHTHVCVHVCRTHAYERTHSSLVSCDSEQTLLCG